MRGRIVLLAACVVVVGAAVIGLVAGAHNPPATHLRPSRAQIVAERRHPAGAVPVALTAAQAKPSHPAARPPTSDSPPPAASRCANTPPPVPEHPITHRRWLAGVTITEYYPAPERWFVGRRIAAPGLSGTYAADWLYSARGLAMEGDGVDLHGRFFHIAALGSTGWVNAAGGPTRPVCLGKWTNGFPFWLSGGWRNAHGAVTFPLAAGAWSNGPAVRTLDYGGVTFAPGNSLPLRYYHSIAVDPRLIPLGSRVYIPAYRRPGGGWFVAQDTGGAIRGRHVDVYRPAPASPGDLGRYMTGQRILVVPPG
jgi:3D (Asp-Asp-Asp) domain-containing protein